MVGLPLKNYLGPGPDKNIRRNCLDYDPEYENQKI